MPSIINPDRHEDPRQPLLAAVRSLDLPSGARIVVGVSGGPDSVALLRALLAVRDETKWALLVAHVNHSLRQDAGADEAFVAELAGRFELPFRLATVPTGQRARVAHLSIETAARQLRRAALESMAAEWQATHLALGHTQDDQAETILLRLARGTGLAGLGGMSPRSDHIIRPFLTVSRRQIMAALDAWGLPYREDESNRDLRHARNLVRHTVLPPLRVLQPEIAPVLARTAALLRVDADYLEESGRRAARLVAPAPESGTLGGSLALWRSFHPALRMATLRALLRHFVTDLSGIEAHHLTALSHYLEAKEPGELATLPHGLSVWREGDEFIISDQGREEVPRLTTRSLSVPGAVETEVGTIRAELMGALSAQERHHLLTVRGPWHAFLAAGQVSRELQVRARRPGDRIASLPEGKSQRLQDLLVDAGVPRRWRDALPVIEAEGRILWVPGLAVRRAALPGPDDDLTHLVFTPEVAYTRGRMSRRFSAISP